VANNLNQYSQISLPSVPSVVNPSYDLDGNMLTNGVWSFTWDAENRLASAMSNGVCLVRNTYDPRSRRIRKEVSAYNASTGNYEPVTCNAFLWDGWNIFREVRDQGSEVSTNYYTWGSDLSGSLQGAGGVGGLLAVTTVSAADPQPVIHFPMFDANGNVTEYVATNGTVKAHYEYSPFGATVAQSGDMADAFTHRFSTKPFDAETGLVMYQLRPYEPGLGRWITRDPIGEEGGILLYGFIINQAVNYVDRLGFNKWGYVELRTHEAHNAGCGEWNRKKEGFSGKGNQQSYIKHFEIEVLGDPQAEFLKMPYRVKRPMAEEIVEKIGVPKDDNKTLWAMDLGKLVLFYKPIAAIADSKCSSGKRCARDVFFNGEVTKLDARATGQCNT
jgi:RHS repeat-associated protein